QHPAGSFSRSSEADAAPVKVGPKLETHPAPDEHQHESLNGDAESSCAGEKGYAVWTPHLHRGIHLGAPIDEGEDQDSGDRDDVVDDGSPGVGAEDTTGVEHLA